VFGGGWGGLAFDFFDRPMIGGISRVVVGQQLEGDPVGGADGLLFLVGPGAGFGAFARDAGQNEMPGVLQVLDQIDGPVAGPDDAQMEGDAAVLVAGGLEGVDLNAAGQHDFEVFHGQGPGEGFLLEEPVEGGGLDQQLGIGRLVHQVLVGFALLGDLGDFGVERVFAGAGILGLAVKGVQAQRQANADQDQDRHGDAQAFDGGAQVGVGAIGEIDRDAHDFRLLPPARRRPRRGSGYPAAWQRRWPGAAPGRPQ
jgi:hypothetical protein